MAMSPQRSNRQNLLDGALRCLERLPIDRITARAIADESGANLASIAYHFDSKDALITAAVIEGLDRWLAEIERALAAVESGTGGERFRRANAVIEQTRLRHVGLVRSFVAALAMAQHGCGGPGSARAGFRRTRPAVARLLASATIDPVTTRRDWRSRCSMDNYFRSKPMRTSPSPAHG